MTAPLDIDQLHTFLAIVDTGSFTKAAEMLYSNQPNVTRTVKNLEQALEIGRASCRERV